MSRKDYPKIKKRLEDGIHPLDISQKSTGVKCSTPGKKNYYIIKTGCARYVVEYLVTEDSRVVNILGIGARGNGSNMKSLKNALRHAPTFGPKHTLLQRSCHLTTRRLSCSRFKKLPFSCKPVSVGNLLGQVSGEPVRHVNSLAFSFREI